MDFSLSYSPPKPETLKERLLRQGAVEPWMLDQEPFVSEWGRLHWFYQQHYHYFVTQGYYQRQLFERRLGYLILGMIPTLLALFCFSEKHTAIHVLEGLAFGGAAAWTLAQFTCLQVTREARRRRDAYQTACDRFMALGGFHRV